MPNHPPEMNRRFYKWFNHNYILLICSLLFLFILIAFLAPIFMKIEWERPARIIYQIYSVFCHQLAFRSWFLFGEQPYYPRTLAGLSGRVTYESTTGDDQLNLMFACNFVGNEHLGYKVALCQRDIAIYGSLLICGIVFQLTGRKSNPLPWYLWLLIGLVPLGWDGISQFGGLKIDFLSWLPARESTPLLRTVTGILFGSSTAFFIFPLMEENMHSSSALSSDGI